LPYGSPCGWLINLLRYPGVTSGFAIGNKLSLFPYQALKWRSSGEVKLVRKSYLLAAEISPEAFHQILEQVRRPISAVGAVAKVVLCFLE
jgi:hypothetical protein